MLHCRIIACNSSVSFESRYDTCSSCFPDDSCPHQSTHCAARPTRLRPLPHAPPPRERHRLHRFRTFPDVSGSSWKFPEVPGRSFPDVSGRSGEGGAALPGPPEMGHTPRQAPPDREPRPSSGASQTRPQQRSAHGPRIPPGGGRASAERTIIIIRERTETTRMQRHISAAAAVYGLFARQREDLPDDALQIEQRLVDRPGLPGSATPTLLLGTWLRVPESTYFVFGCLLSGFKSPHSPMRRRA